MAQPDRRFPPADEPARRFPITGVLGSGGGGTTIVQGTDTLPFLSAGSQVWTNMPAAETEFLGNQNRRLPYQGALKTECMFVVGGAGVIVAGAVLRVKYDLAGVFTVIPGLELVIDAMAAGVPPVATAWISLPVGARIDSTMAVFGQGGNAAADPSFTIVHVLIR